MDPEDFRESGALCKNIVVDGKLKRLFHLGRSSQAIADLQRTMFVFNGHVDGLKDETVFRYG